MLRNTGLNQPFAIARSIVLVVLLIALVLSTAGLFRPSVSVLLLVFAGLLFGVFISGVTNWVSRHIPVSYLVSYLCVVGTFIVIVCLSMYYLGAQVARRADQFSRQLQTGIQRLGEQISDYQLANQFLRDSTDWQSLTLENASAMLPSLFDGLQWATWGVTGGLVILFVGLYAAYDPNLYRDGLVKLVPKVHRRRTHDVLGQLSSALSRWILGRLLSMAIVGVVTSVFLWLLGVPLPITLGAVAAFLAFIPNIGPLLAAIPQMLLALNLDVQVAIYVLVFNVVLQGIESYLITPMIQQHEVTLPPILTITGQLLMGVLFGIIGVMMAAPLLVVSMVIVQTVYVHDYLGDRNPGQLAA